MMKRFVFLLSFLLTTGAAVIAQEQERPGPKPAAETGEKFRVGMAGYSFVRLNDLDKSLSIMQRADVHYLCIKDFHLPFKSTTTEIAAFHAKLKEKGVTGYAVGPIYMKTEAEIDPRIGMCLDIGHDTRNGKDAVADLKLYISRVFDIHIKDVTGKTKLGYSVEIGRGVIDLPAFVKMLRTVGYTGVCSLEYERDMAQPDMGIAESIGYFRAVIATTK